MKDKEFFCIEPYVGMSIIEPGHAFCCCLNEGQPITNTEDTWNDPYLISIREKFNNNKIPKECAPCVSNEKHTDGRSSRRLDSNRNWLFHKGNFEDYIENDAPYKLDFWTGNICNLACVTCSADDSSFWATIQKRNTATRIHRGKDPKNYTYKKEEVPNINYKNLQWVHFNGGEPLLTDTHLKVLKQIPSQQRNNVHVQYNTNGTVRADIHSEKYQIFKEFISVNMMFSLDGIEETFEYTRWPAKWDKVRDNIDFWLEQAYESNIVENDWHLELTFNIVKSAYNYDKIDETIEYVNNRWITPINESRPNTTQILRVFLCNDHRHLDYTNKDFKNFRKNAMYLNEKKLIDNLRKSR